MIGALEVIGADGIGEISVLEENGCLVDRNPPHRLRERAIGSHPAADIGI